MNIAQFAEKESAFSIFRARILPLSIEELVLTKTF